MKSITNLSIMIICLFSLCLGQTSTTAVKPSTLEAGQTHTYEFYENGTLIGYNQYTVTKREFYNETEAYFIDAVTDLKTDLVTLNIKASYIVDLSGRCLHYEFEATVNGELQTMKADFVPGSVHITASKPGKTYDETIRIGSDTFTLDNNMIDQWDVMFSAVTLEKGSTLLINMVAAQPMKAAAVKATISQNTVSIEAAQKTWECLKLEFSSPAHYIMYVTPDGHLVKMENDTGLVIVLKE